MPLQPPNLDDRDFDSLFREARSRIPRYLPEWTDWNESDPGITLLQLQAWLAETILYRLNQLPDLNYIKFLQLLGIEQQPAQPAQANLTFWLKDEARLGVAQVLIPQGTVVGVALRDLEAPLVFETDRTLRAITASIAKLVVVPAPGSATPATEVTLANQVPGQTFRPFGDGTQANAALLMGLRSNLPFPREEVGLQIDLAQVGEALLAEPEGSQCGDDQGEDGPVLAWEWWNGDGWADLDVTADDTRRLTRSGQVYFRVPGQLPLVPERAIAGSPAKAPAQLEDVQGIDPARAAQLRAAGIGTVTELVAQSPEGLVALFGLDASQESDRQQMQALLADAARLLTDALFYWLRLRLVSGSYASPPQIDTLLTNTVPATAAQTVVDEAVGSSDGSPNQVMALRHRPILADPPFQLEVDDGEGAQPWEAVPDFYGSGASDAHYVLNRTTGEIQFGDGRRGRIPTAGQFNVIARRYRYGGGRVGNVGADTITDLSSPIPQVDRVTNGRPAVGGLDEERLSDTKLRAPREIKAQWRAVTLEDFTLLAQQTPGALVARAFSYVRDPSQPRITVVIVPQSREAKPVPSEAARRLVCRYLDERRLITTQLQVQAPQYHDIDVALEVRASDGADLRTVKTAIAQRLSTYFHPLTGGADGQGWPFGRDLYYSELMRELMLLPGIRRVVTLQLNKLVPRRDETGAIADPPYFTTQSEAQTSLSDLQQREQAEFPDAPPGTGLVIPVTVANPDPDLPPETRYYAAIGYGCSDLPVSAGALLALREAQITVEYDRGGAP